MKSILHFWKNEGETPLECLDRLRTEQPTYKNTVLSYAGRLDPMAEGVLLVLVDEENKKRLEYLGLNKTYEVEVLCGISTDTGDILGLVNTLDTTDHPPANFEILQTFVGPITQKYPHYSSKTVNGKPLFQYAREGKLDEIEIPEKTSEIFSIELLETFSMTGEEILKKVKERIARVKGDFRQQEIIELWEKSLTKSMHHEFPLFKINVRCSSGTYMRTLAEVIGKKRGKPSLAWRIVRTCF